jgi:hypothetical protein
MSTVCKILVGNTDTKKIAQIVYKHMIEVHGDDIQIEESDWPILDSELFLPNAIEPTIYYLKVLNHSFTELQYNSFSSNQKLCEKISKALDTSVVVIMYQSTVDYCYWAYYQDGEQKRLIESAEGELLQNQGEMLPFESEPIGHNFSEDGEEEFYVFELDDMEEYTKMVGINALVYHDFDKGWKIIKYVNFGLSKPGIENKTKPWWNFW